MRYGRAIALAGLMAGLVGLSPEMSLPAVAQVMAQTADQRKAEGDRQSEGDTLNNIGITHHQLEQYTQALEFYQQALVIRREVGNRRREGISLSSAAVGIDGGYRRWIGSGNYGGAVATHSRLAADKRCH